MKTDAQIRSYVMRRVYAIYWARQLAKPVTKVGAFAALGVMLGTSVSIINVLANALAVRGVSELAYFVISAFTSTTPVVQLTTLALAAMVGWVSVDGVRKLQHAILPGNAKLAPVQ